jgi:hypothetical protein
MTTTVTAPAQAPTPARVRPGRGWYWLFGILLVGSLVAGGAVWFGGRLTADNQVKAFARFLAPNQAQLRFKRGGDYTLYYEYKSNVDGTKVNAPSEPPSGIDLAMQDANGQALDLRQSTSADSYSIGDHSGVPLRQVTVGQPGDYSISVGPDTLPQFALAVGRGATPSTDTSDLIGYLIGGIGGLIGLIGLILVGVRRHSSKQAIARDQAAALAAAEAPPIAATGAAVWSAPGTSSTPPPPPVERPGAAPPPAPGASPTPAAGVPAVAGAELFAPPGEAGPTPAPTAAPASAPSVPASAPTAPSEAGASFAPPGPATT